jgi:DNA-binding XRE family transcriptional regulator
MQGGMKMYKFKINEEELKKVLDGRTKISIAKKVGKTRQTIINVLNRKYSCRKETAYCITKALDSEAEISDFFTVKK